MRASPLVPLLGAVAVATVAWALLVPPFMVPDEAEHFAYTQSLVENGERPQGGEVYGPDQRRLSSEVSAAVFFSRTGVGSEDLRRKPAWERSARGDWDRHADRLAADDAGGIGVQARHPPLYYAYEAAPYAAGRGGDVLARLHLMRLWSALLLLVATTGAWLLIGELTGRDRLLQLAGAACVGLQPMSTFISAGVNPDALLFASYSIAFWLAARLLRRGPSRAELAGLVGAVLAAGLTKPSGLALVPGLVLVLAVLARRHLPRPRLALAGAAAVGVALAAAGIAGERRFADRVPLDLEPETLRGFGTYLWDFYLPLLPFQERYEALSIDNPAWTVWVEYSWGAFGHLEVRFPDGVFAVLAAVAVLTFVLAGLALARSRFALDRAMLAFFALTSGCLVLGLHWVDFHSVSEQNARQFQGRYLLPLMPVAGVAVAAALRNLPRRRELAVGLVLGGLAVLQLASLAIVSGRYFA